jgi:integrase
MAAAYADSSRSCGDQGCASRKRSLSRKATSINAAGRSWSDGAREGAAARSAWTRGAGNSSTPWLDLRRELPIGPLLCVINGTTRGRHWSPAAARAELRRTAAAAGVRRRFAPHQLRHAHAVEMAREGVPLIVIQRQLGHSNLGITSVYLQGIDSGEIIETVHARRAPMIPVSASLRL